VPNRPAPSRNDDGIATRNTALPHSPGGRTGLAARVSRQANRAAATAEAAMSDTTGGDAHG